MGKHIKKLVIYDFDSTLCKSPENTDENKALWEEKTGGQWARNKDGSYKRGWWGKEETLDPNVFDIELVEFVKEEAIKDILDVDTYAVLLTGRRSNCSANVKEILRQHGVPHFNKYLFNTRGNTQQFKVEEMGKLFKEFPNLEEYTLWEDRIEHIEEDGVGIPSFRKVGNEWASTSKTNGKFVLNIITKDYELKTD
jgi:hypothetical protein